MIGMSIILPVLFGAWFAVVMLILFGGPVSGGVAFALGATWMAFMFWLMGEVK